MTLRRVAIPTRNYGSRGATKCTTIILHTAEGARTYSDLGHFFQGSEGGPNPVSSHVGIDDTPGTVGEYVQSVPNYAWTQGSANRWCTSAELCGFAAWDAPTWAAHQVMIENTAAWVAEEAARFGIPIVKLTSSQAQDSAVPGVAQHIDLGQMGGGHVDCGSAFSAPGGPYDQILAMAAGRAPAPAPPAPTPEVPDMLDPPCTFTMNGVQQAFYVDANGRLQHHYQPAGKPWVGETTGGGWDPTSGLAYDDSTGVHQIWGVRADGRRAQCYWSGSAWVTQLL